MSYRSPLSRARGLGSAGEGVHHWWRQRLTAVALVPLLAWLVIGLSLLGKADYASLVELIGRPYNAILLILTVLAVFYHAALGLQVIFEDYIGSDWLRMTVIVLVNFSALALAVASVYALLKIAFGMHS